MKLKGNGGYQIIDFEKDAPNTLDVNFFEETIARGKPLWVNNLVVNGETYSGVASVKKTLTSIIVAIASINIVIALSDGSTTYENETIVIDIDEIMREGELVIEAYNTIKEKPHKIVVKDGNNIYVPVIDCRASNKVTLTTLYQTKLGSDFVLIGRVYVLDNTGVLGTFDADPITLAN